MSVEPEIRALSSQRAAVQRAVTDRPSMPATIDGGFSELFAQLEGLAVSPADAPFIRYLKTGEQLEIELGVPVASDAGPLDGLDEATLPAGRTAVLRHVGPYEELRPACERLFGWVEERGLAPSGPFWESYVTNPAAEADPGKRITDIYVPLA